MSRDPLNFFQPYEGLPPSHENQLTRALLLVLRLSPMAHAAWMRRVSPDRQLERLPVAAFKTQERSIRNVDDDAEEAELVSVFLAPDQPLTEGVVQASNRSQVLDGVIDYGGELVVVLENKVVEGADPAQAREIDVSGARVRIAPGRDAVMVSWRELLEDQNALLERGLVSGAEAALLNDFLAFTEDHFGGLGPFRTLALCKGNGYRQNRRLRALLNEIRPGEARIDRSAPNLDLPDIDGVAAHAYLAIDNADETLALSVYPADTLTQARTFYQQPELVDAAKLLASGSDWKVRPNFHFGHMQRGYVWTTSSIAVDDYLELWVKEIQSARAVDRNEWDAYWTWLYDVGIATAEDRPEFDRHFTDTDRKTASPRPGIELLRVWKLSEAEEKDSVGALAPSVEQALDEVVAALEG